MISNPASCFLEISLSYHFGRFFISFLDWISCLLLYWLTSLFWWSTLFSSFLRNSSWKVKFRRDHIHLKNSLLSEMGCLGDQNPREKLQVWLKASPHSDCDSSAFSPPCTPLTLLHCIRKVDISREVGKW